MRLFDEERNPALLALQAAAHEFGVPFLWDDDEVSLGYGQSTLIWTPDALPSPLKSIGQDSQYPPGPGDRHQWQIDNGPYDRSHHDCGRLTVPA